MATGGDPNGLPKMVDKVQTFVEMMSIIPQPNLEVVIPFRPPKVVKGDLCVVFERRN